MIISDLLTTADWASARHRIRISNIYFINNNSNLILWNCTYNTGIIKLKSKTTIDYIRDKFRNTVFHIVDITYVK